MRGVIVFFGKCFQTIVLSVAGMLSGIFSPEWLWRALGFEALSREQAAQEVLSREVRFNYRPAIVEIVPPAKRDRETDRIADNAPALRSGPGRC